MGDESLQDFIEQMSGDAHLRVQDDLGDGFVRLRAAEAQRRQALQDIRSFEDVVIEMLRNARDAGARAIFVATWTEGTNRHLTMIDDGDGIPSSMHETVFEPFVTSKLDSFHSDRWGVHGRGMALYSIKQNTDTARVAASAPGLGSVFEVVVDSSKLGEKRDQSTPPTITRSDDGALVLRGPHNITRTVMEFCVDERGQTAVYLGSPSEIVATLYALATGAATQLASIFSTYDEATPYIQRFAYVDDSHELAELAASCSLPISERTAHRILKGDIKPLRTHLETLIPQDSENSTSPVSKVPDASRAPKRSYHFEPRDLDQLKEGVRNLYADVAQSYYLNPEVEPEVKVRGDELVIRIPLKSSD